MNWFCCDRDFILIDVAVFFRAYFARVGQISAPKTWCWLSYVSIRVLDFWSPWKIETGFFCVQELALKETLILVDRATKLSRNNKSIPTNTCNKSYTICSFSFRHNCLRFAAFACKICLTCSVLALDVFAKKPFSEKFYWNLIFAKCSRNFSQRLYRLTANNKIKGSNFGNFASMEKAFPKLSSNFLVDWAPHQSTTFPFKPFFSKLYLAVLFLLRLPFLLEQHSIRKHWFQYLIVSNFLGSLGVFCEGNVKPFCLFLTENDFIFHQTKVLSVETFKFLRLYFSFWMS